MPTLRFDRVRIERLLEQAAAKLDEALPDTDDESLAQRRTALLAALAT